MYDPNIPATNAELTSAMFRGQFQGLKALIDAIVTLTAAQVDGVSTLNPGDPATVTLTVNAGSLNFLFGIPRGQEGVAGQDGAPGAPFANVVVDSVTTLPPGSLATVTVSFDGSLVHLSYGIPAGEPGVNGEVTNAQLTSAIATTALNPSAVAPLNIAFSNPPTDAELNTVQAKINELIAALFRA